MPKSTFYLLYIVFGLGMLSCSHRPSKLEQMRLEKAQHDSITYVQAKQNLHYSDSLLQVLLPEVDQLMPHFVYSKNEKAEDHGHYVHQRLQTVNNASRSFLQAYISDNRELSLKSYYAGTKKHDQHSLELRVDEDYVRAEGSNHAFSSEGWHEILTIQGDDALQLLAFIANHPNQSIRVISHGHQSVVYTLTQREQQALTETYQLSVGMRNIDALERAIHVANLQMEKYEKKHPQSK